MSDKTIVHVMRHGEVFNPDKILYGRLPDYHLSDKGRAQAERVADWLADRDIVYVVASPLERAQETATPIAERRDLPINTDDYLIESMNIFQGQKVSPGDGALRDPRNWWYLRNPRTPSWGEPYAEIAERMKAALHRARVKGAGHEAVCVSHQLPVETLRRAMTGKPLHHFPTRRLCNLASRHLVLLPRGHLRRLGLFGAGRSVRWWVVIASAALVALAGCSTGDDAVAQGGTFEFVAPGGKTDIFYDPPESRGSPGRLAGPSLMDPAKTLSLDDFAGKVVVVNVWGQWCGPCRAEISQLQQVYDATKADGVAFLGIDVRDNNRDAARDFVTDRKVTFPSIYDPSMRTMIAFGGKYPTTVIPSTVVLDREHRVAAVFLRELLASDLQPVVARLVAEPAPKT